MSSYLEMIDSYLSIHHDNTYACLLKRLLTEGIKKTNRTGINTYSIFGEQLKFPLNRFFPLLSTKFMSKRVLVYELAWFLRGDTNIKYLNDNGVHIWDEWADENGDLGPIYGKQWTDWNGINQVENLINTLQTNPFDRRMILSAWNVPEIKDMRLPPCHFSSQYNVTPITNENGIVTNYLNCNVNIRSNDYFLGAPYNIAQYALLVCLLAKQVGMTPGVLTYTMGDVHIYENHIEQAMKQLQRYSLGSPILKLNADSNAVFDTFKENPMDTVDFQYYRNWPAIKAEVAV